MGPVVRLLQAIRSLTKSGGIKKLEDAYRLAQRELGETFSRYQNQIKDAFDQGQKEITKITNKPTADIIPFRKKEGIESLSKGKVKDKGEVIEAVFKPGVDKRGKRVEESPSQASGTIMDRIEGASNRITEIQKEIDQMYKPKPETSPLMERLEKGIDTLKTMKKSGMDPSVALTKTLARSILNKKGIEVPERVDPIEVFEKNFGGDALMDVKDVAEEMIELERMGKATKSMDEILEQSGMFNIKRDPNAPKGLSDEEIERIKKEVDQEKQLKDFDPTDREPNSEGGINRTNFNIGSLPKGIQALVKGINKKFGKGTMKTADEIDQPEKTTQQLISEFEAREKANKEMDAIVKDQIEGGFIRDMERSMQRDMQRELKKPEREILDVPPVPEGFKLSKEKLMAKFPELDEAFADEMVNMDKDTAGRLIKMLENRRLDPEAYDRLLAEFGDTLQFQKEFDKYIRRKKNAEGGLQYLMGM
jgi:hypothetical protein